MDIEARGMDTTPLKCSHDSDCSYQDMELCLCVKRELESLHKEAVALEEENRELQILVVKLKQKERI